MAGRYISLIFFASVMLGRVQASETVAFKDQFELGG